MYWGIPTAIPLIALICYGALLFIAFKHGLQRRVNRFFALYLLSMLVWSFGALMMYVDNQHALLWNRVMISGLVGMPVAFFGFVRGFLRVERWACLLYLGGMALVALWVLNGRGYLTTYVYFTEEGLIHYQFGPAFPLFAANSAFFLGLAALNLIQGYRQTRDAIERNRIRYALFGISAVVLGTATNLVPALGAYPVDIAGNVVNALLLAYAIFRYQLLDITFVVRRGLAYAITVVSIVAGYLLIFFALDALLHISGQGVIVAVFAVAAVIVLAFPPLRERTQLLIDRLFFREKYDSRKMLQELSQTAASLLGFDELTATILDKVTTTMGIGKIGLLLEDGRTGGLYVAVQRGIPEDAAQLALRKDHPLIHYLAKERLLTRQDAEILPQFKALWTQEKEDLAKLGAEFFVPLKAKGKLVGIFAVGPKLSGETYSPDDQLALTTLANQTAVAVENARLYWELEMTLGHLEQMVAARTNELREVVDNIPMSILKLDRSLNVVSANQHFLRKSRRKTSETIDRKIGEILPASLMQQARLLQKLQDVFESGQPFEGEKVRYFVQGLGKRDYFYRLIPLKEHNGEVQGVMLLMEDITEREKLTEEVRQAERHLASVVECANDLVVSLDPHGHIVTWNQAAERTFGLKAEQAIGRSLLSLCAAEQQPVMAGMLQGLAHGKGVQQAEVNLLTTNGQEVPIAWSCSPMRDDTGQMVGLVAVGRDLTERRRLEAQLIQSAKMTSLGVMAGGIAHELRNPLGIISASAQLLLERPDDAQLRSQCAQKTYAAAQRASLIIENLLKFARPSGERMQEVDLHAVLEATLALLAYQVTLEKVTLQKEFQPGLPRVHGNPDLLQQVFINLILNACNAMPQGGTLTVVTRAAEAGQVEVRFSDTGRGIPPEHLPKVFDPFFTTMPVGKGIGLGLSISYSLIQQHQGIIEVASQVGKGSIFTVRLPGIA